MDNLETFRSWVKESKRIVFFGGAGVSTESGIPDFRSVDGLYNQKYSYPPEMILSHSFFLNNPTEFYRFYRDKILIDGVEPNITHKKLAELEAAGKLTAVVTQNIDGLHQRAGSRNVQEVHGSTLRNYCMKCHEKYPADFIFKAEGPIPKCPKCGGMVRPDVTLYGEGLPQTAWIESKRLVFRADCLIIGGTSLAVQPAASLAYDFSGENLIIINRDKTFADRNAKLVFHDNITEVLDSINLED